MLRRLPVTLFLGGCCGALGWGSQIFTFTGTCTGSSDTCSSTATLTFLGSGTLLIDLVNNTGGSSLLDVSQALSGFRVTLPGTSLGAPPPVTESGNEIAVAAGGVVTSTSGTAIVWRLALATSATSTAFTFDDLSGTGHSGPALTLLGDPSGGVYSSANSSITGNSADNPFIDGTFLLALSIPGVTSSTTASSVAFQFGTTDNEFVSPGVTTPEPVSLSLTGGGLILMGLLRRRRTRSKGRPGHLEDSRRLRLGSAARVACQR